MSDLSPARPEKRSINLSSLLPGNRTILKDSTGIFMGNAISIGLGMLTSVIMARALPMADLGRYQLIISYLAIGQIAALPGMNVIVNKAVMKGYDGMFNPVLHRSVISACIASILVLAAGAFLYLERIHAELGFSLLMVGCFLPILGFEKHDAIFLGKKRFTLSRQMSIYSSLAATIVVGSVAFLTKNLYWVIGGLFFTRLLTVAVGFALARKCLRESEVPREILKDYLSQGWHQTWFTVFVIIVGQMDKVVLGTLNVHLLAVYYVGTIMPVRIKDNVKTLFGVIVTHWSALDKLENYRKIRDHWPKIVGFGLLLTGLICILSPLLIPRFYGKNYADAVLIAQLLSLSLPFNLIGFFILNSDVFQNKGAYNNYQSLIRQIGYILLLLILVPLYGYFGVIGAILAAEFGSGLAAIVYFMRELKKNPLGALSA